MKKTITRSKGGMAEREVPVSELKVPDLWKIALKYPEGEVRDAILECWHLAHDLLRHVQETVGIRS